MGWQVEGHSSAPSGGAVGPHVSAHMNLREVEGGGVRDMFQSNELIFRRYGSRLLSCLLHKITLLADQWKLN